jgi:hypothetical protein
MEQMMAYLLAKIKSEIRTNRATMEANRATMEANQAKTDANLREMRVRQELLTDNMLPKMKT